MTARRAGDNLFPMDALSSLGSTPPPQPTISTGSGDNSDSGDGAQPAASAQSANNADSTKNLTLLKKSHDLAKDTASRLLESLPPPRSPSPPGTGGKIDLMA
ncbi:MAG: putative motility protein [Fibrobacteres bacterium]|nr:putative motility protein [Fibrobacterota bacterium]